MLNVHSVSEVNILRDSSGVLRVIIGCQDPCITKKNKKKNIQLWPERRVRFLWRRWMRWESSADGPNRKPRWRSASQNDLLFTDLKIVHTCAHSSLGTPQRPCSAVSKWRLREVLKNAPLSRCPIPARTTKVHRKWAFGLKWVTG